MHSLANTITYELHLRTIFEKKGNSDLAKNTISTLQICEKINFISSSEIH